MNPIRIRLLAAWLICVAPIPSCAPQSDPSIGNIGPKPAGWTGGALSKNGKALSSIWFSPDKTAFVQQITRIQRSPTDSVSRMLPSIRSGHAIDDVRSYKLNGRDVMDVRCRPLSTTSQSAKFSRFLVFDRDAYFDSILFASASRQGMNLAEFREMYRRLGVSDY